MATVILDQEAVKKQYIFLVMTITMFLVFENLIQKLVRITGGVGTDTSQAIAITIKWGMWLMVIIGYPMHHYYKNFEFDEKKKKDALKIIFESINPFIWLVFLNICIFAYQISRRMRESHPPDDAAVFIMSTEEKKTWNIIGIVIMCCSLLLLFFYDSMPFGLPSTKSVGMALLMCTVLHSLSIVSYIEKNV